MTDERTPGPVPVRDLMSAPASEPERESEPAWKRDARELEMDGEEWTVRPAGAGCYGTGRLGAARLMAVHFFHARSPDTPVREALLPAGEFATLREEELRALFHRATVIDVDER